MFVVNIIPFVFVFSHAADGIESSNQEFDDLYYSDDVFQDDVIERLRKEIGEDCDEGKS